MKIRTNLNRIETDHYPPVNCVVEGALGEADVEEVRRVLAVTLRRAISGWPDNEYGRERKDHYITMLEALEQGQPVVYRQFSSDDEVQIPAA